MAYSPVTNDDVLELRAFLSEADLTIAGLDSTAVRLWVERDHDGNIVGSTGYEASTDGADVLIRSVAVSSGRRTAGAGTRLARFALEEAASSGATRAWLFSRRSGPFWQKIGFGRADRDELAAVLSDTQQVRLFTETGQLEREVAWMRELKALCSALGGPTR
ncbi:N-acetylglutamate synthase-like GNAT family acetyltransferase [Curtobacterium sp. PhB137]|uniref:GNAT family N-acetyltransferase n=1 Tax=Curtobacterium sp. PhB137 TaxID=2485182 RepID=UPI000F513806|nr:GNAT family N-acetyltransferase [Curtobacterium sp. PhB137]RPE74732.1 N-acetylglutamate synthase-like GNAT family acetyltransferase [Curtobacterium sp. PhB137]